MGRLFICLSLCAAIALASASVGTLNSSGSVVLSGSSIPATAASSLPIVAGDRIQTSGSPAIIVFADKSQLTIAANSQVVLVAQGSGLQVQVISGSASLDPAKKSTIELIQSSPAPVATTSDKVQVNAPKPPSRSKDCPQGRDRSDGNCGVGNDK
jgi:hypothetical protein